MELKVGDKIRYDDSSDHPSCPDVFIGEVADISNGVFLFRVLERVEGSDLFGQVTLWSCRAPHVEKYVTYVTEAA